MSFSATVRDTSDDATIVDVVGTVVQVRSFMGADDETYMVYTPAQARDLATALHTAATEAAKAPS